MARPLLVLLCVLLGHVGWWLFCYNRCNATGLPRRLVKTLEKCFILACVAIPVWIAVCERVELWTWLQSSQAWWPNNAPWFCAWGAWCAACCFVLGPEWLDTRRSLTPPTHLISERSTRYDLHQLLNGRAVGTKFTRLLHAIPGNQIASLEVSEKVIQLGRHLDGFDRIRVAHLSDLHFTGQMTKDYCRFAIERVSAWKPDLIALTGDIIDYDNCLDWIEELLADLQAPQGCYFLMGNHERKLRNWSEVPRRLCAMGWRDLGTSTSKVTLPGRLHPLHLTLIGNELPWFNRFASGIIPTPSSVDRGQGLYVALSHSPDQIEWARDLGVDLLLAGHTHGGQVRLPGIGPLVAPSWYGSRFASGVFHLSPTVMHVSRGLAGVHPLRWNCMPEVSLLTIIPQGS